MEWKRIHDAAEWKRIDDAAEFYGVSSRTIRKRIASGELASYLEGEEPATRRWVWCRRKPTHEEHLLNVREELAALRAEVAELRKGSAPVSPRASTPFAPQRSPESAPKRRPAQKTTPRPSNSKARGRSPMTAAQERDWSSAWSYLLETTETTTQAGKLAGLSQSFSSRLTSGKRIPARGAAEAILEAARARGWSSTGEAEAA